MLTQGISLQDLYQPPIEQNLLPQTVGICGEDIAAFDLQSVHQRFSC